MTIACYVDLCPNKTSSSTGTDLSDGLLESDDSRHLEELLGLADGHGDEQVGDDDAHQEEEDEEDDLRRPVAPLRPSDLLGQKVALEVELPAHHDENLDDVEFEIQFGSNKGNE